MPHHFTLIMKFLYQNKTFAFDRYPQTDNQSLKAWNAGDEYMLKYLETLSLEGKQLVLYNDRFGFLSGILHYHQPYFIIQYKSQYKALQQNFKKNNIVYAESLFLFPLQKLPDSIDIACIKIPKSNDLFELYLLQLLPFLKEDGLVICSFMTRHFSKKTLTISATYFEEVEQSKAWKKSRLLILKKKKNKPLKKRTKAIFLDNNQGLTQYLGVFSGHRIDIATQFLLQHLLLQPGEEKVLDLASGNGIIAYHLHKQKNNIEVHLLDDDYLAIESSKLNLTGPNSIFHWNDTTEELSANYFDLIVCNPPFHFEYENTIEIALKLFKGAKRCLKKGGRFLVVANLHLNYKTHLIKLFDEVNIVNEDARFVIYECW